MSDRGRRSLAREPELPPAGARPLEAWPPGALWAGAEFDVEWAARLLDDPGPLAVEPLPGDASPRRYARLSLPGRTLMLMSGPDEEENLIWLCLGRQLWYHGLPVPRIYHADLEYGRFLHEDLGRERLDSLRDDPRRPGARVAAHREAAQVLAGWHAKGAQAAARIGPQNPPYNPSFVFRREWGYFVSGLGLTGLHDKPGPAAVEEARQLCADAASGPKVLIHRDFQSRNIMIKDGRVKVIDWQGARLGPAAYDVASFMCDPYAAMPEDERRAFWTGYLEAAGQTAEVLEPRVRILTVTRLMQAFGAYAALSMIHRRTAFAPYLAPALSRLGLAMAHPDLDRFPLIRRMVAKAAERLLHRG